MLAASVTIDKILYSDSPQSRNTLKIYYITKMDFNDYKMHEMRLRERMDELFAAKAKLQRRGKDPNAEMQANREYRNPSIMKKMIELYDIEEHGTNFKRIEMSESIPSSKHLKSKSRDFQGTHSSNISSSSQARPSAGHKAKR